MKLALFRRFHIRTGFPAVPVALMGLLAACQPDLPPRTLPQIKLVQPQAA